MRERDDFILADLIATRAETGPDFGVLTFEGADVREDEIRTYSDLLENGNRVYRKHYSNEGVRYL